ncbi:MAG: signal peptide peptidase SppA [Phocaeicola sp.]|uniref:signal peptide peptidase SppA n=1 Tax=Phocaeicola sp. TaxID=2773926 RepID=UPI003F9FF791
MKDFLKYVLATLVAIVLAGIVFIIIGIVSIVGMFASSDSETKVWDNSIFELKLDGNIVERYKDSPFDQIFGEDYSTYGLDDILSSIKKAKENEKIKGIYLESSLLASSSFATNEEIRRALLDFKESGKFIVAYADQYTQGTYYIASVADKVISNPQGSLSWHGLASEPVFYKELLDKLGVQMQVFKVGTYKSAVEPFTSTQMSDANREQVSVFINDIWEKMIQEISESRNIPVDSLNAYADKLMDLVPAEEYLKCGMVDTLIYKSDVSNYLKQLTGTPEDENLNTLLLEDMINVKRSVPKDKSGNALAVYYAYGEIDPNGGLASTGSDNIDSKKVAKDLAKLSKDKDIKAIVLRVNSPGGSAYGSEQIWNEVQKIKGKKPIIVSMGDYAASGGYYISCAADTIVAEATTLTGSIGIFGMFPDASNLLTNKLGIHFDVVKSNKMSDFGSLSRPLNEEEKAVMQNYINHGYATFIKRCADGRHMTPEAVEKIAEGRVWTGERAKDLGLVDVIGGLDTAIDIAAKAAGIENYSVLNYPAKENVLSSLINTEKDRMVKDKLQNELGEYFTKFQFLRNLRNTDPIQARLPFDLNIK